MKRLIWSMAGGLVAAIVAWAAVEIAAPRRDVASLMPDGALLYLEAKDFRSLLKDWNDSQEKRTWLKGDDYAAFSRSRLFERLSQAQDEFSTAASIPADSSLLSSVAGTQSALALYDIGNLEFVYVTRLDQSAVETSPLWQVRSKFEQRTEGKAQFFVHKDPQSNRTAAFAARDGWLVLATREDLVAGVLDRIQGVQAHSLPDEEWYANAVKQANRPADDLRMVLNLEKIVPSPYFRSYWVQRNVTEMKQYRASISDLHRTQQKYSEDRVLLRKLPASAPIGGGVLALSAIVPDDATFSSAETAPSQERVLAELRENLLELKPERAQSLWSAPAEVKAENAGAASELERRIDVAPVIVERGDPYQGVRELLAHAAPTSMLRVYATRAPQGEMFVDFARAMVLTDNEAWDGVAVQKALTSALRPALTTSQLGVSWTSRHGNGPAYFELDGPVSLFMATHDRHLLIANDATLLERLLRREAAPTQPSIQDPAVTYAAVFRHSAIEQRTFRKVVDRLDRAGHNPASSPADDQAGDDGTGQAPAFFSGNIASLSRMFSGVVSESVLEKDQGATVTQSVVYQWKQK